MPQTNTTTTTITTTAVREGFKLVVDSESDTVQVGNFVTDVSIQPYIADQIVSFYAYNMRPFQRMHVFFDSVNVDQYCAPGEKWTDDTSTYLSIARIGNWGAPIYADEQGHVAGQFAIPGGTFKTGDRMLEIADVDNLQLGADAISTKAAAMFTASNLSVSKQIVTLTTVNPILNFVPVTNTVVTVNSFTTVTVTPDIYNFSQLWWEPVAQALTINTPDGSSGVFATSIEVYFKQKSPLTFNGVGFYVCETDNGYPNGSVMLPFSWVWKPNDEILVSNDATVPTVFTFESPVFLQNNKTYAFVIKPDQNDPDFFVWTANLGDVDVATGVQVTSQPVVGTAFYGSTVHQWTALQTEYVKFKLNVAQFSTGEAVAEFTNSSKDYLTTFNVTYANTTAAVLPGDIVFQASNGHVNSTGSSVNTAVYGVVDYFDTTRQLLYVSDSTGNFVSNSYVQIHRFSNSSPTGHTANQSTLVAHANTFLIYNPRVNTIVPQFATMTPPGTSLEFEYTGISNTYVADASPIQITVGGTTEFKDKERLVLSRTNEVGNYAGQKSMKMRATLKSDSPFVSPVIDTVRAEALVVRNLVDPLSTQYEEFYSNSRTRSKYVSQVVTLAEGQDAEDLQVILTAHRPPQSEIQVWCRFWNKEDPEPIASKTWTPMRNLASSIFCDPNNPDDMREFVYSTPFSYPLIGTYGTITCNTACTTVTGFSTQFGTQVNEGYWINMKANNTHQEVSRKVEKVISNTSIVISEPFTANYTNSAFYVVPPPTAAWMSTNSMVQITGTVTTSTTNNVVTGFSTTFEASNAQIVNTTSEAIYFTSANTYFNPGDRIFYSVPRGNTAIGGLTGNTWYYVAASNTSSVKLTTTSGGAAINLTSVGGSGETHGFNKTNFAVELGVGDYIQVGDDQQRVVSITNAVSLVVEKPWTDASVEANVYSVSTAGVTYLNLDGSRYSSFKKFQIKVVLQTDDSSKIPLVDDLRAMALQM